MQAPNTYGEYRKVYDTYKSLYGSTCAIFYQVGSFFELYDVINKTTGVSWCNVKDVIDILGIQLSIKQGHDDTTELLFAGFPDYALHRWAAKLTQIGWTVVVVEQKKDLKGKVEVREVTRVLSPGTHHEATQSADSSWIVTLWVEESVTSPPHYGIAGIDLTTGDSTLFEGCARGKQAVWSADEAVHFMQVINPREVVFLWRGDISSEMSEATVRRVFGIPKQTIHFRQALPSQQGSLETATVRLELLKKHFEPATLLPVRDYLMIPGENAERALCCLLRFIEDHISLAYKLNVPKRWSSNTTLSCGNNALLQLNFVGSQQQPQQQQQQQQSNESVLGMFHKCITPMGKRAIRNRLLVPLIQKAPIDERLARVDAFYTHDTTTIQQHLSLMFDLPRLHRKILNMSLTGGDVLAMYQTYKQVQYLMKETATEPCFQSCTPAPESVTALLTAWDAVFSLAKAESASENKCFLRSGIVPLIDSIEAKIAQAYEEVVTWMKPFAQPELKIEEKEKQPISVRGPKAVMLAIQKSGGPVGVPVGDAYRGLDCKITKSVGHTLEAPFLDRINERILGLRVQLAKALQEALPDICIQFFKATGDFWAPIETYIEEIDCTQCVARVAKERGFFKPTILAGDASSFKATALRHPLIEALPSRTKYVTHNVELGDASFGWLLYGMNASGKSSLMKAIGIAVLLAQCGSYVPATHLTLVPFEKLMTRILNVDNLWAGLSSFAVEISELRDIFLRADARTLVLGDELCSGTESVSATALVAAGIQYLLKKQSRFVFATHYHDLLRFADVANAKGLSVWHLKVRYNSAQDILVYDRTLSPGAGSTLYGIEVAKALGMPQEILDESVKYRRTLQGEAVEEELSGSSWNPHIVSRICEVCHSAVVKDLEVHHIRPRMDAVEGATHFEDGEDRDSTRNLIVVCAKCHDAHHAGLQQITVARDTSVGVRREVIHSPGVAKKREEKEKYSSEQLVMIQKTLQEYPGLPVKMIRGKLLNTYNIHITEAYLRNIR